MKNRLMKRCRIKKKTGADTRRRRPRPGTDSGLRFVVCREGVIGDIKPEAFSFFGRSQTEQDLDHEQDHRGHDRAVNRRD
jgi:hypothetical protein